MAAAVEVNRIESNIRFTVKTKRIRVKEFFHDFDKLRSGYVTGSQFLRILWQNLGIKLNSEDEAILLNKYDLQRSGRINYNLFCDEIESQFNTTSIKNESQLKNNDSVEYLGSLRTAKLVDQESEEKLVLLLQRLHQFNLYHGHDLRSIYRDFDKHNNGLVTESQFYRALPVPGDITEADIALLVRKYHDPEKDGLVNYLNLYHDIITLNILSKEYTNTTQNGAVIPPKSINTSSGKITSLSVQDIIDRLRITVHKNGVRVLEFFRDYDKLRHDLVTENQFVNALTLALGRQAQLTRPEIQSLANYYMADDGSGRIRYREFCSVVDAPFHILNLEKKPCEEPIVPSRGALSRKLEPLSANEEMQVEQIVAEIQNQVRQRRIMMYQYFKDFDRSMAYTRVMTENQFGRMLHFLSINVSPVDLKLLARKFCDSTTGDVNYPAFVQLVDGQFVGQSVEQESCNDEKSTIKERDWTKIVSPKVVNLGDDVPLETLMARIRHIVLSNRLRIKSFFEDFDQLRTGRMSRDQFRRCLSSMGLSKLGSHDLTDGQCRRIMEYYQDSKVADKIVWTSFVDDVSSVFGQPNLESNPLIQIAPSEQYLVPKPGTLDWQNASADHQQVYEEALHRMRQKVDQRRMLVKPTFKDFDRHNHGHITRSQFRQVMTILELIASEAEMQAIEARFSNDEGFNYFQFLEDLEPTNKPEFMYAKRLQDVRLVNSRGKMAEMAPATDFQQVMHHVMTTVYRKRLRLHDFLRDYDKLRTGRMPRVTFRRALDQATLALNESQLSMIEDRFLSSNEADSIEWLHFVDEVERIFTQKNLEKEPLAEPMLFVPTPEVNSNVLTNEEETIADGALMKITPLVRERRMQLFPLFQDFDRVKNGTLSQNQFRRVLASLQIASGINEIEWAALYKKFLHQVGTRCDVNYMAFVDHVYALCGFEHRKP